MTSPADGGGGARTTVADAAADSDSEAHKPAGGRRTTPAPRAPGMAGWLRTPTAAALAAVLVGIGARLWALTTSFGQLNGDQAVTGIMVQRILSGRNHYVFFAGQQYNGSLEQYLQAAMYWLFPVAQNASTLRYPQIALTALATWLIYLAGCRLLHRPWAAVLAAGLFAVGPYWTFYRGLGSFGSYADLIVVGLVAVYAALRLRDGGRTALLWSAVFGISVGLVTWLGLSAAELLIPAGLIAAPYFVRSWRLWLAAVPAVVLGAAPVLWWSVQHGTFALANAGPPVQPSTVGIRFRNLFGPVLREFIGVAFFNGTPGWPLVLQYAAVIALAVAYVVAVVRHRRGIISVILLRTGARSGLDVLLVSVPLLVVVYCASRWAWVSAEPRYLYAFSPVLLWCLAAALPARPSPVRLTAVLLGCVVFAATSLTMIADRPYRTAGDGIHDPRAVATFLRSNGEQYGYADYWTAMPILYASGDTLDIASMTGGRDKFPDVTYAADTAPTTFYVAAGPSSTARNGGLWVQQRLDSHSVTYRRTVIGTLVVFDRLSPALKPWQLQLGPGPSRRPAP